MALNDYCFVSMSPIPYDFQLINCASLLRKYENTVSASKPAQRL